MTKAATEVSGEGDAADEVLGVRLTHADRVLFPGQGITKRALADYYISVADSILSHVAGRPLSLVRCPAGIGDDCFFQKHATPAFPSAFRRVRLREKDSTETYLAVDDARGLVAAAQMGVLELHVWGSHVDTLEKPDRVVLDLDPDEAVPFATVAAAARELRERLEALGLVSFVMATGGKGLHVVVPLAPRAGWQDVKAFAEALARRMAADAPETYLAEASLDKRAGRIFIDYLRNGRGATAIAPFSTRARSGAPLAWPVAWAALAGLTAANTHTVGTAADDLAAMRDDDPWAGYFDVDQVLPEENSGGG